MVQSKRQPSGMLRHQNNNQNIITKTSTGSKLKLSTHSFLTNWNVDSCIVFKDETLTPTIYNFQVIMKILFGFLWGDTDLSTLYTLQWSMSVIMPMFAEFKYHIPMRSNCTLNSCHCSQAFHELAVHQRALVEMPMVGLLAIKLRFSSVNVLT